MNKNIIDQLNVEIKSRKDVIELLRFSEKILDNWLCGRGRKIGAGRRAYEKRNELLSVAEHLTNDVEDYFTEFKN